MSSNLLSAHLCSWKRPNISSSNPNMESTVFTVCEDTFLCLICNIQFTFRLWCNWIWSGLNSLFPCNKQLTVWDGSRKSKSTEPQIIDWILHMLLILCSGVGTSIHTKSVEPLNHKKGKPFLRSCARTSLYMVPPLLFKSKNQEELPWTKMPTATHMLFTAALLVPKQAFQRKVLQTCQTLGMYSLPSVPLWPKLYTYDCVAVYREQIAVHEYCT